MPRQIVFLMVTSTLVALLLLALAAKSRHSKTPLPRVHIIQDMDNQQKYRAQMDSAIFADHRSMRPPVPGTVAVGDLKHDEHYFRGIVDGEWATELPSFDNFPVALQSGKALIERGAERYAIFCQPCHAADGSGKGPVTVRAQKTAQPWVTPSNLRDDERRARPVGHLFNSISNGIRNMAPYASQIPEADRWAIVAYVRALQRTVTGKLSDLENHPNFKAQYNDIKARLERSSEPVNNSGND